MCLAFNSVLYQLNFLKHYCNYYASEYYFLEKILVTETCILGNFLDLLGQSKSTVDRAFTFYVAYTGLILGIPASFLSLPWVTSEHKV